MRIIGENGQEAKDGDVGELALKSWVVMEGYYKDAELTSEVLRNGWFYTGDLARRDEEGFYYIVGRKRDMIKVSGQIVFPSEVEEVMHRHPAVKEVAVVGVADSLRGEAVRRLLF